MIGSEFASCWLKILRAEEHFSTFNTELTEWIVSNPYSIRRERNADGSRHSLVVDIGKAAPLDRWSLIAGDCIHNLRTALDYMVYALAVQKSGTRPPPNVKRLQFPIVETAEDFESQRPRISGLSVRAQELIERAQPYHRPREPFPPALSILNEFENGDKHRLLNIALTHVSGGKIDFLPPVFGPSPEIHWLRTAITNGTEVAFFTMNPAQPDVNYKYEMKFYVTVTHVPSPSGRHVDALEGVLSKLIAEVKRIVNSAV